MDIYDYFLEKFNITFKNKSLIRDAFTHASYVNETQEETNNYERLEFMGDAIVEVWVTRKLFNHIPAIPEGQMTTARAQLVCEKSLSHFLREMDLPKFIRLGAGEEKMGGRNRDSLLCDVFEAMIAAIYLDKGYKTVEKVLDQVITIVDNPELTGVNDYKTKLQEYVQAETRQSLTYTLLSENGTPNNPEFEMGVYLDGVLLGVGKEKSKKKAEQLAAKEALEKMAI